MKTITDVTLYDLMAEDLDVWINKASKFVFNLQIDDENGKELVNDKNIHPAAAASLADFCRHYLQAYEHATKKEVA